MIFLSPVQINYKPHEIHLKPNFCKSNPNCFFFLVKSQFFISETRHCQIATFLEGDDEERYLGGGSQEGSGASWVQFLVETFVL